MLPLSTLRQAANALTGERQALAPSVGLGGGPLVELPADTTAVAGGAPDELARVPALTGWLAKVADWISGSDAAFSSAPIARGDLHLWAVLAEGAPSFDPAALDGAIPRGSAFVAALRPDLFIVQAADRLEAAGHERGTRLAARLRTPSGNLDVVRRFVETVALSVDASGAPALRLRVGCVDPGSARQAVMLLQGWRLRRAMGDAPGADVFRSAEVLREGRRVELRLEGQLDTLLGLFGGR